MALSGRTRLQIINLVLPRLREATVATSSTTVYSTMISTILDEVKAEIEFAHRWRDLRNTYSVTAVSGTTAYTFTDAGPYATILDAWNTTNLNEMKRGNFADFNRKFFGVASVQTGIPTQYLPAGVNSSNDLQVDIWPSPSSTNVLKFNLYVPQLALTSDSTVVTIPNDVLVAGMVARAMAERGDDGDTAARQEAVYQGLLASAIAFEVGHDDSELTWTPE